jgi:glucose/arabinose dehydrogenase
MKKVSYLYLFLLFTCLHCRSNKQVSVPPAALAAAPEKAPESPVLSPTQALQQMQVEPGFAVKLVAAEPLLNTPVALSFDAKGRMWVVEMETFMTDTTGTDENKPRGRIVILEDRNQDGQADHRQVFLDSLLMPRALCLLEQGLLVAEPPRLWYVERKNDRPGRRTLVDDQYTEGGNVESQANGLYRALDNWVYSGGSDKRYRLQNGKWRIERTHMRGQWGLCQDDHGRLYYNNNSQNLLGDYFSPALGAANGNQKRVAGFSEKMVPDNRVYPARPTPGVNRGYKPGVLDDSSRLVSFTAGCGPVVYRGGLFGPQYAGNAFVAEPAANLIKRNVLAPAGHGVQGRQAYRGREFLASTDERFRPVSLYDGPDGALYVVDMYRGIIQYKMFLTEYLKREIRQRELYRHLTYGRIYKIVPQNKSARPLILPDDPAALVPLLGHANGWVRDKAQQRLVDAQDRRVIPALQQVLRQNGASLARIHALWTLEGLGALAPADVLPLLRHADWTLRRQALSVLPAVLTAKNYRPLVPALARLVQSGDTLAAPYVAFAAQALQPFHAAAADNLLLALVKNYPTDRFVADAVVSNLQDREAAFARKVQALRPGAGWVLPARLKGVLADIEHARSNRDVLLLQKQYPRGVGLFRSACQPCHGADGKGVKSLAPPLDRSEWVTGNKDKLSAIVLFGLTGPGEGKRHALPKPRNKRRHAWYRP